MVGVSKRQILDISGRIFRRCAVDSLQAQMNIFGQFPSRQDPAAALGAHVDIHTSIQLQRCTRRDCARALFGYGIRDRNDVGQVFAAEFDGIVLLVWPYSSLDQTPKARCTDGARRSSVFLMASC